MNAQSSGNLFENLLRAPKPAPNVRLRSRPELEALAMVFKQL
jgi:hypothetical protein